MKKHVLFALFLFALIFSANIKAQTLTIADTVGKNNKAFFIGGAAFIVEDFGTIAFPYSQVVYGLSDKFDVYLGAGTATVFGQTQANTILGFNANLYQGKHFSVSSLNQFITPLNDRKSSCSTVWFNSTVLSKNFEKLSLYTGYNLTVPLGGNKVDALYTPLKTIQNIPFGAMLPIKNGGLFIEYNAGTEVQLLAFGLSFNL